MKKLNGILPYSELKDFTGTKKPITSLVQKFLEKYHESLEPAIDAVNYVASLIPARRNRKLHIGLYGYSGRVKGKSMPRAILFTGAFYSLGMPPEFIGIRVLKNLSEEEYDILRGGAHAPALIPQPPQLIETRVTATFVIEAIVI